MLGAAIATEIITDATAIGEIVHVKHGKSKRPHVHTPDGQCETLELNKDQLWWDLVYNRNIAILKTSDIVALGGCLRILKLFCPPVSRRTGLATHLLRDLGTYCDYWGQWLMVKPAPMDDSIDLDGLFELYGRAGLKPCYEGQRITGYWVRSPHPVPHKHMPGDLRMIGTPRRGPNWLRAARLFANKHRADLVPD